LHQTSEGAKAGGREAAKRFITLTPAMLEVNWSVPVTDGKRG